MKEEKEYFAFISYKSEDVEWAIWLQHELEHYHLPASFNGRTDIRQELRPVFRDIDELSAGNLPEQIKQALENSQNLIVVCSPQAAASHWVNKEVETFISLGRTDRIFPFIVEGNSPKEFFPPSLLALPENEERLGGDASKQGRDVAFVKVVAGMLGLGFDSLWDRYEREKAEEERKQREQRDKLLIAQSRFVAEKANDFIEKGDSYIARKALLELYGDSKTSHPYVAEADKVLRRAVLEDTMIIDLGRGYGRINISSISLSKDGSTFAIATYKESILLYNAFNGKNLGIIKDVPCCAYTKMHFSKDNKTLIVTTTYSVRLYNLSKCELLKEWNEEDTSYHNRIVNARFVDDEKKIIVASNNGKIVFLDITDFTIIKQFQYEIEGVYVNRGKSYVEDSYTGEITERHSIERCQLSDFIVYMNSIYAIFNDGKLRIIQCKSGQIRVKRMDKNIHSIHITCDKKLVIASYATLKVYNPNSLRLKHRFDIDSDIRNEYIHVAYLENNLLMISFDSEKYSGSTIRFYLCRENKYIVCSEWEIKDSANITKISIDDCFTKLLYLTDAGKVRLWSPSSLRHRDICRFNTPIYKIYSFNKEQEVAIETKDEIIIINHFNGEIRDVIDKNDEKAIEQFYQLELNRKILDDFICNITLDDVVFDKNSIIMTTSGYGIICGKNGKTLIIDTCSSSVIKELVCPDDYVDCIFNAISPDEKYIVAASRDGFIYIWELDSTLLMQTYNLSENISSISFSYDGTAVLIGTETGVLSSLEWHSFTCLIAEQKKLFSKSYLSSDEKNVLHVNGY